MLLAFVQISCLISALGLIVVTMLQVTKAETGGGTGSLGFGSIGGRSVNTPVGTERILKPLTMWFGITFLFSAALQSVPRDSIVLPVLGPVNRFNLLAGIGIPGYVLVMWFRGMIASWIRGTFPSFFGEE